MDPQIQSAYADTNLEFGGGDFTPSDDEAGKLLTAVEVILRRVLRQKRAEARKPAAHRRLPLHASASLSPFVC